MKHLDLLGTDLKSEFLCDLFETYEVAVVYEYDRTHEGLADEYRAEIPELGLQFVFDEHRVLKTLFVEPVEVTTFNPFEADARVRLFESKAKALRYAREKGLEIAKGTADFMGERREWVRFEGRGYSVHYEYVDSKLSMVTLQAGDE